jgi:hypothetical protein
MLEKNNSGIYKYNQQMNILSSRLPALKFLAIAAVFQYGLTVFSNVNSKNIQSSGMPMFSIQ